MDALDAINGRRSHARLEDPPPDGDEVEVILRAAVAAPDHGHLRPWRFILIEGSALHAFGDLLAAAYLARCERDDVAPAAAALEKERRKPERAPLIVVAVHQCVEAEKVPPREQLAAVAAASQNILLAATALGYGSIWRTGPAAEDPLVREGFGLGANDSIVGFLYIGSVPGQRGGTGASRERMGDAEDKPRPDPWISAERWVP